MSGLQAQLEGKTLALTSEQRQELLKMGVKLENFVRQALMALDKNCDLDLAGEGREVGR